MYDEKSKRQCLCMMKSPKDNIYVNECQDDTAVVDIDRDNCFITVA